MEPAGYSTYFLLRFRFRFGLGLLLVAPKLASFDLVNGNGNSSFTPHGNPAVSRLSQTLPTTQQTREEKIVASQTATQPYHQSFYP